MSEAARTRYMRFLSMVRSGDPAADQAILAALRTTPRDPNLLQLAGQVAESVGEPARAIQMYRRALAVHAGWMEVTFNLARLLALSAKPQDRAEADSLLQQLAQLYPDQASVWEALAHLDQTLSRPDAAAAHWQRALTLAPDNPAGLGQLLFLRRQMCDWQNTPAFDPAHLPPQMAMILCDDPAAQKTAAQHEIRTRLSRQPTLPPPLAWRHDRLRIGYLSSDFHAHATAFLMAEIFALHDRAAFEIFAYSYGIDDKSAVRERIKKTAEHFIDLSALTARACAERIRKDEIDILIDLKGHTTGGRLDILAYRPAPRQLHWLGFPGTIGAPFIDAFVADEVTVPTGEESTFAERIIRLPCCYQINDRQKKAAPPKTRASQNLPDGAFVLAAFNQTYKITPEIFALWCDLLREAPQSVLWLFESNPFAATNLRAAATANGIDPARLIFAPPAPQDEHLARYHHADLALDTFPVGGHTTTSDALWMGVPVVTLSGHSFASRVAASLLTAAQLPDLITTTPAQYKALALSLITDAAARAALRARLHANRAALPLFDTPARVKEWESLLRTEAIS